MKTFERSVYVAGAVLAFMIVGIVIGYYWSNIVPTRPTGVSSDAVFLRAPNVGLPAPRRGWWVSCWEHSEVNRCRLSDVEGGVEYEGKFVLYGNNSRIPMNPELVIDPEKTSENKLWVGDTLVPIVYLKSGDILVPEAKYEEAKRLLELPRSKANEAKQ